jgi:hypothetical protein
LNSGDSRQTATECSRSSVSSFFLAWWTPPKTHAAQPLIAEIHAVADKKV